MVESPCIKVCKLHDDICIGCIRSIDEIRSWKYLSESEKLSVLDQIAVRKVENAYGEKLDWG